LADNKNISEQLTVLDDRKRRMCFDVMEFDNKKYMKAASPFPGEFKHCRFAVNVYPVKAVPTFACAHSLLS
jgi:hypothetical protein